jgi:hypothetical protein
MIILLDFGTVPTAWYFIINHHKDKPAASFVHMKTNILQLGEEVLSADCKVTYKCIMSNGAAKVTEEARRPPLVAVGGPILLRSNV